MASRLFMHATGGKVVQEIIKWDKVFTNEPCKICGRQPLKNSK